MMVVRGSGSPTSRGAAISLLIDSMGAGAPDRSATADLLAAAGDRRLLAIARYHGVSGFLWERLRALQLGSDGLMAELRNRYEAAVDTHMRALWALSAMRGAIDGTVADWVVVKGPIAVEELYGGVAGLRPYHDLDLVVHPSQFGAILDALSRMGGRLVDRNWYVIQRDMRGEVHVALQQGLMVDLHWNVINMYRGRMRVGTPELLSRSRPATPAHLGVRTLDRTDGVLYLALHAGLSGGDKLLWLEDIQRASAAWDPDWDQLSWRAEHWGVGPPVGLMLERARVVLGADVPRAIPARLAGKNALRLAGWLDAVWPWHQAMGHIAAPPRLFVRSMARGPIGAVAWLAWRTVRNLDPGQERRSAALTPRGDGRDKDAFIRAVIDEGRN